MDQARSLLILPEVEPQGDAGIVEKALVLHLSSCSFRALRLRFNTYSVVSRALGRPSSKAIIVVEHMLSHGYPEDSAVTL